MKKRRGGGGGGGGGGGLGCHRMAADYASEACATCSLQALTFFRKWDDVRIPSHLREIIMACHSLMDSV